MRFVHVFDVPPPFDRTAEVVERRGMRPRAHRSDHRRRRALASLVHLGGPARPPLMLGRRDRDLPRRCRLRSSDVDAATFLERELATAPRDGDGRVPLGLHPVRQRGSAGESTAAIDQAISRGTGCSRLLPEAGARRRYVRRCARGPSCSPPAGARDGRTLACIVRRVMRRLAPYAVAIGGVIGITAAIGFINSLASVPGLSAVYLLLLSCGLGRDGEEGRPSPAASPPSCSTTSFSSRRWARSPSAAPPQFSSS